MLSDNNVGVNPIEGLIWNEQKTCLCGVTEKGGTHNFGTIFMTTLDGNKTIHSFDGSDGKYPLGEPIYDLTSKLIYCTTKKGGLYDHGTIFSFNPVNMQHNLLHSFNGLDGDTNFIGLIAVNNSLFGCATNGGMYGKGTIFSIVKNGTGFRILHHFTGDGANPACTLCLVGFTLFGTTLGEGLHNYGTLFSICTNGKGFKSVHDFSGTDASYPNGNFVIKNNILYGASLAGGKFREGSIYSLDLKTLKCRLEYSFNGITEGRMCYGGLTFSSSDSDLIYGVNTYGGLDNCGTLFSFNVANKAFKLLYSFSGKHDGGFPVGKLTFNHNSSKIYGTTYVGGFDNCGTVYAFDLTSKLISSFLFYGKSTVKVENVSQYRST